MKNQNSRRATRRSLCNKASSVGCTFVYPPANRRFTRPLSPRRRFAQHSPTKKNLTARDAVPAERHLANDQWQFVVRTSDFYLSLVICHLSFDRKSLPSPKSVIRGGCVR